MDDIKAKQQIIEKIKESTNILVTVSNNPTVDALSAAIGLTLLIDKLDKHGTAIFSGVVPPAIAFLEPEKILDDTTDSLRDFIIALDKEKADHLRYKVEGDSVKIFITPYKTTITSSDLEFSQGDYNVELIIALGVDDQDHLDKALESHGQILHDATVVTVTAGAETSTLGGIDWHDDQASSLSEMITGLSEALKTDKNKSLIDTQIATAFLTGIVAQTERFSNRNTTAKVMTIASSLMAAGADQQLIATKLAEEYELAREEASEPVATVDDQGTLTIRQDPEPAEEPVDELATKTNLSIEHTPLETLEEMDQRVKAAEQAEAAVAATEALDNTINTHTDGDYVAPPQAALPSLDATPVTGYDVQPAFQSITSQDDEVEEPALGGTLNATADQAADDARREEMSDQNKTILTHHSYLDEPQSDAPSFEETPLGQGSVSALPSPFIPTPQPTPTDLGLPMPPPLPDFSTGPAPVPAGPYAPTPTAPPERLGDILAPEPGSQPFGAPIEPAGPYAPPPDSDQGQFKIPGQQ